VVVDYILRYLAKSGKTISESVLDVAGERFKKRLYQQFMTDYEVKAGGYGANRATKCVRANGYYHAGIPQAPMDPEVKFKLWFGDLCELGVLALAELAYEGTPHSIGLNNEFVEVPIGKGELDPKPGAQEKAKIKAFIDGLLNFNWSYHVDNYGGEPPEGLERPDEHLIVEVKSMGSWPFERFVKEGPDDTWGYLGQVSVEQRAMRVRRYIMIAIDRETGRLAEYIGFYNKAVAEKADATYDEVMEAKARGTIPNIPAACAPQMKNGSLVLGLLCNYCGYRGEPGGATGCWADAGYELSVEYTRGKNGPKPVFYVTKRQGNRNPPRGGKENDRSSYGR
jgi:hypothetical protein